jgi:hypothetical protein
MFPFRVHKKRKTTYEETSKKRTKTELPAPRDPQTRITGFYKHVPVKGLVEEDFETIQSTESSHNPVHVIGRDSSDIGEFIRASEAILEGRRHLPNKYLILEQLFHALLSCLSARCASKRMSNLVSFKDIQSSVQRITKL